VTYKFYSIFYLVVIVFYLIRPSLPYIEYVIAREHIETCHCVQRDNPENTCHGKCYLHEQLNKQIKYENDDTNDNKILPDKKMEDHLLSNSVNPGIYRRGTTMPVILLVSVTVSYVSKIFVPPKK